MTVSWAFHGRSAELAALRRALTGTDRPHGALLVGAAGSGKSWLLDELRRTLPGTVAVQGAEGTRTAALGALAPLLPERTAPGGNRWRQAAEALAGAVVCVDDAHLLDPVSAALLQHLVLGGRVRLLAAVRSGAGVPEELRRLAEDRLLDRLELAPFTEDETGELLTAVLGPVAGPEARRLHRRSQGNPLLLRELVLTAVDDGALRPVDGVWDRPPGLPPAAPAPRLADLVEARIGGYGHDTGPGPSPGCGCGDAAARSRPELRELVELLALSQPLEFALLLELADVRLVEEAEARGLLRVEDDGRRCAVRLVHPLLAEVAVARCPRLRARRHHRELVRVLEATGARRAGDALRLAEWRLAGGLTDDPGPLLTGARDAWAAYDTTATVRLAAAARDAGGGTEAALLLAEALSWAERYEEAERVLADCAGRPMGDAQRTRHALLRAHGLSWGLRDFSEAERVLREVELTVSDPGLRWEAGARRVALVGARGDYHGALELAAGLLARPVEARRTGALLTTTAVARAYTGRPEQARQEAGRARGLLGAEPAEVLPLRLAEFAAEFWAGDLDGAERAADAFAAREHAQDHAQEQQGSRPPTALAPAPFAEQQEAALLAQAESVEAGAAAADDGKRNPAEDGAADKAVAAKAGTPSAGPAKQASTTGTLLAKDGKPLSLRFVLPSGPGSEPLRAVGERIARMLQKIGIATELTKVADDSFFKDHIASGQYDLALYSWPATAFPATDARPIFAKPEPAADGSLLVEQNYTRVGTDHIDQLFDQAAGELDEKKARELMTKADARIWAAAGSVPLYQRPQLVAVRPGLVNAGAFGLGAPRYQDIGWKKPAAPKKNK
ncbi:hypothetical protein [Streptomyces bambusae]|uniref:hypothetical protein n=1 Tax=Streptomyces bambusae TaxID=1550616 RepID=UPI0021557AB0|nr:hypothetical protein [Streptomyces bambusae]